MDVHRRTGNYNDPRPARSTTGSARPTPTARSISGYTVTYDGAAHTATGSCQGVDGDALAGLDLSGTTHTNAGTYNADPWTFTE